jgi:hypothetical protein
MKGFEKMIEGLARVNVISLLESEDVRCRCGVDRE